MRILPRAWVSIETLGAVLVALGWLALWVGVSFLAGSWAWLLIGAGALVLAGGILCFWRAGVEAEIRQISGRGRRPA